MEVQATVSITIAGQTIQMTMEEAKELKAKLDQVVPIPTIPPFMQGKDQLVNRREYIQNPIGGSLREEYNNCG